MELLECTAIQERVNETTSRVGTLQQSMIVEPHYLLYCLLPSPSPFVPHGVMTEHVEPSSVAHIKCG